MMFIHDADHPYVEKGIYVIGYVEMVDGYRHAYFDASKRKVRYSRNRAHPTDPRCPECAELDREMTP